MPPHNKPSTPSTVPACIAAVSAVATAPGATAPGATAPGATKEDDNSRAGSMTLLLPHQITTEKQVEQGLHLQRPRRRLVVKRESSECSASTWVLALLGVAAIMAAVAAAATAMAARAEIFRLKADVEHLRNRLGSHEALNNYIHRVLEPGMAPVVEGGDEDVPWDEPYSGGSTREDLSPSYPEANEFEFPADVKSNTARHNRRHIPTIGGSYTSSENGWRPGKSEKRLKLYDALTSGTLAPEIAVPAVPAVPKTEGSVRLEHYHHRSRVMEQQTRNDASWRKRNQMHIQHHLQRQTNTTTPKPKPALLMEFSKTAEETAKWQKGDARNVGKIKQGGRVVAAHFNIDANRRSKTVQIPSKTGQTTSWCSSSWMSQHGQHDHFSVQTNSGLSSIIVRTPGIYYVYAQANPETSGLLLQRNGRRQTWCKAAPGSTCFTASVVALDAGDSVVVRTIDGQLLNNTSASLGFIRLDCPQLG